MSTSTVRHLSMQERGLVTPSQGSPPKRATNKRVSQPSYPFPLPARYGPGQVEEAMPVTSSKSILFSKNNVSMPSEPELVAAAKSGQPDAFGELCERHAKKVFRVTHRITRNREDAEDAVQDSFLSAFIHLKDFDERSRFATWLTRIAINSALLKLRKKRAKRELPMDEPSPVTEPQRQYEVPDSAPNPEEIFHLHERKEIVSAAIDGLRPRARKVVELNQLHERSTEETAQILGISTAAVKARMFHAKAALRRMPLLKSMGRSKWASSSARLSRG